MSFQGLRVLALESRRAAEMEQLILKQDGQPFVAPSMREIPLARNDEAFAIFRENAKKHPDLWFVHSGLARIYCSQGKYDDAAKEMKVALSSAPDNQKVYVDGLVKKLENRQDIN